MQIQTHNLCLATVHRVSFQLRLQSHEWNGLTLLSSITSRLACSHGNSCKDADTGPAAASVAAALAALLTGPSAGFRMLTAPSLTPSTTHCWHRRGVADRAEPTLSACENPQASSNLSHASGLMIGEPVHKRQLASIAVRPGLYWFRRTGRLLSIRAMRKQTCDVMLYLMARDITQDLGKPETLDYWAQRGNHQGLGGSLLVVYDAI